MLRFGMPLNCKKCGEKIANTQKSLSDVYDGYYHFECATLSDSLDHRSLLTLQTSHIEKLQSENTNLRHKVDVLTKELLAVMTQQGASPQDVEDVQAELAFYD